MSACAAEISPTFWIPGGLVLRRRQEQRVAQRADVRVDDGRIAEVLDDPGDAPLHEEDIHAARRLAIRASSTRIYEDRLITGKPLHMWSRGRRVVADGQLVAERGPGRFLKRRPHMRRAAALNPVNQFIENLRRQRA